MVQHVFSICQVSSTASEGMQGEKEDAPRPRRHIFTEKARIGSASIELGRSLHSNPSMGSVFKFPQRTPFSSMIVFLSPSGEDRVIS